jgi:DNA-binding response OmpR family regulator
LETLFIKLLLKNGSKISTEDEVMRTIWGDYKDVSTTKNLASLLSRLRKKLPKDIIKTHYGIGYRLSTV